MIRRFKLVYDDLPPPGATTGWKPEFALDVISIDEHSAEKFTKGIGEAILKILSSEFL
jgi:hypothetical protein